MRGRAEVRHGCGMWKTEELVHVAYIRRADFQSGFTGDGKQGRGARVQEYHTARTSNIHTYTWMVAMGYQISRLEHIWRYTGLWEGKELFQLFQF